MYLLDANVLIEAKNRYYAFDLVPRFWAWLDQAHERLLVASVEAVRQELAAGEDELADWSRSRPGFFRSPDALLARSLPVVATWIDSRGYTQAAVDQFFSGIADLYLVADGLAHDDTVVTLERSDAAVRKRVLIPNVCDGLGVAYCDTFAMLRATGAVLGSSS